MPDEFDVFISYSVHDRARAEAIFSKLRKAGIRVWFDVAHLRPGQSWATSVFQVLESARLIVILIGSEYSKESGRSWVQYESQMAFSLDPLGEQGRILPALLPGADPDNLPIFIRALAYRDLRDWSEEALDHLVAEIEDRLKHRRQPQVVPKVFLCHAKEDDQRVSDLYFGLRDAGFDPWYDKEKLDVGDRWEEEIISAIEQSDFFAVCMSKFAANKTGFIQKEIRTAVRQFQRRSYDMAFLLTLRLEECEVPNVRFDENTTLRSFHWLDIPAGDARAFKRLTEGIWKQWQRKQERI